MNPYPYTDDVKHQERLFSNPDYKAGWEAGLEWTTDITDLTNKIDELEQQITIKNECIELLNNKIVKLEDDLQITWYHKLWSKIPRISIVIKKGV